MLTYADFKLHRSINGTDHGCTEEGCVYSVLAPSHVFLHNHKSKSDKKYKNASTTNTTSPGSKMVSLYIYYIYRHCRLESSSLQASLHSDAVAAKSTHTLSLSLTHTHKQSQQIRIKYFPSWLARSHQRLPFFNVNPNSHLQLEKNTNNSTTIKLLQWRSSWLNQDSQPNTLKNMLTITQSYKSLMQFNKHLCDLK